MTSAAFQVGASSDDAREGGGTVVTNGTTMTIASSGQWIGCRFTALNIPPGSAIDAATLEFNISSTSFDDPNCPIYAEAVDDAATFTTASNDISGRTRTTASVTWSGTSLGTGWKTTPDISAVIQEVINRAGWTSGNDLNILMGFASGANVRVLSYDNAPADAPILNITWTPPGSAVKFVHYARMRV